MSPQMTQRKLALALFSDIVGYSSMMQRDEAAGLQLAGHYRRILEEKVNEFGGNVLKHYGDGSLSVFDSTLSAVRCAYQIQLALQKSPAVPLKIGMHIGDIVFSDSDIFGDGVNIASRIESLGQPSTVLYSKSVHNQIKNYPEFKSVKLGFFHFKNIEEKVEVYALANRGLHVPNVKTLDGKLERRKSGAKWPKIALYSLLMIALVLLCIKYLPGFNKEETSIAVLPFNTPADTSDIAYLGNGIAESVINRLSLLPDCRVISRSASFTMNSRTTDVQEIARKLKVNTILTGSLEKRDQEISINAELINPEDHSQLWGQKITHPVSRILVLEEEIATNIAEHLRLRITPETMKKNERISQINPAAYEHYLKGKFMALSSPQLALGHFQDAITLDPNFALGYSGIADVYANYVWLSLGNRDSILDEARAASLKALSLDPDLAEAHTGASMVQFYFDWNFESAEKSVLKAIQLKPHDPIPYYRHALICIALDQTDQAIESAKKSVELDPITLGPTHALGICYMAVEQYEKAAIEFKKAIELHPTWTWGILKLGVSEALAGNHDRALEHAEDAENRTAGWSSALIQSWLARIYSLTGKKESLDKIYKRMKDHLEKGDYVDTYALAEVCAMMGKQEEALSRLNEAVASKSPNMVWVKAGQKNIFADLRENPAFLKILEASGFTE